MRARYEVCGSLRETVGVWGSLLKFAEVCRSLRKSAEVWRRIWKSAEVCENLRKTTKVYRSLSKFANLSKFLVVRGCLRKSAWNLRKSANLFLLCLRFISYLAAVYFGLSAVYLGFMCNLYVIYLRFCDLFAISDKLPKMMKLAKN